MRNDALIGFFCILYGTFFWGLIWFPFRLLNSAGVEPIQGSALSFLIATILALSSLLFLNIILRFFKTINHYLSMRVWVV